MELMVVIAIIGLLVSIVTVSIRSSRSKGNDTGVKRGLSELQKQAEIFFYANDNSYSGICTDSKVSAQLSNTARVNKISTIQNNGTYGAWDKATCHDSVKEWAVEVPLAESSDIAPLVWCVDGIGRSAKTTTLLDIAATTCTITE